MPSILPGLSPVRLSSCSRPSGESGPHDEGRMKAGLILMTRIRYQEAIGLEVKRGRPAKGKKPSKQEILELYIKAAKPIREVADELGCTKDMVHRALAEYGIKARSNASRSKLRTIPLRDLEAKVNVKGIRGTARDMGIHENTLRHYLKGARK